MSNKTTKTSKTTDSTELRLRIPAEMYDCIVRNAEREYRTVEQQALWTLKRGIELGSISVETMTSPNTSGIAYNIEKYTTPAFNIDPTRNWDGSPRVTCATGGEA